MKYFISQVMNGMTAEAIKAERAMVIAAMEKENPEAEAIDSVFEGAPHEARPLWFLGKSFELLSMADLCIFVDNADTKARGCRLEYEACVAYGIDSCSFDTQTGMFTATSGGI